MEELTSLNISKICRVCLLECDPMYSIFSEVYEDQVDLQLGNVTCIYEILGSISSMKIQADDGLPTMICTKCIDMAHQSYKFQKQCNNSQIILEAYVKQCNNKNTEAEIPIILTQKELDDGLNDLNNLEQINSVDLVINNDGIDPNDFLIDDDNQLLETRNDPVIASAGKIPKLDIPDPLLIEESKSIQNVNNNNNENKKPKLIIRNPDADQQKNYPCKYCDKSYKFQNSLRVHMRNHTEENPYDCKICGKEFKQYATLLFHQRSHSGEQPFKCEICGKKYKQQGTLTAHMRIHTGQKPFLCSICGRGFRQAPDLGYHMRVHTKERPYQCNVCGKTMTMQSHLVQHMRIHTGERPYKCTVCEKSFPSSTRLKRHAIIHTGLKPYKCDVCQKSFNRLSTLKVHAKTHTDERAHICPICNKGFIQAHALKSHLVTHSSELTVNHIEYLINDND